ncbi:hypothetical protein [Niveibacterium sp. SC-1]|uniref:hypothetical protein n=1 Tax=Niveibacterium sp. SC-1 TaxID=3135646 RepID=UPI00311D398E
MDAPFKAIGQRLARATMDRLGDVVVVCESAPEGFVAALSVADVDAFDRHATIGDFDLRYLLEDATLRAGDEISVDGKAYIVAADPRRLSACDATVTLREAA